jgi:site-specific DNA recombinase
MAYTKRRSKQQATGLRALGVVRLSRHSGRPDDPTTSPVRQREAITAEAERRGLTIVGWAEDLGTGAAKVPPWDRAELGGWLQRPDEYDALIFWKLDRLCRSVRDFSTMVEWATTESGRPFSHHRLPPVDRVKNLISTTGEIDLTTNYGKAMASVVAVFAELEADIITERVNDARSQLYDEKRWHGGRFPFGYKPEKIETGGWRLVIDPDAHTVLMELIDRMLAGEPAFAVQMDFEKRGIPTPKGGAAGWRSVNISGMLRSRALLGEYTFKAITDDGLPGENVRAEPLVPLVKWNALQELLGKNPKRQRVTGAHMLLDVAFCAHCLEPMYLRTMKQKRPDGSGHWEYRYLGCGGRWSRRQLDCEAKEAVRAEKVESLVSDVLLEHIGDLEVVRTERVAGVDYSADIEEQLAQVKRLAAMAAGLPDDDDLAGVYAELIAERRQKIRELRATPTQEAGWREVLTGRSYREVFDAADSAGKRRLLLDAGVRVEVRKAMRDGSVRLSLAERPGDRDDVAMATVVRDDVQLALFMPRALAARATGDPDSVLRFTQRPIPFDGERKPFTADV